jgi:uncharacterized protein YkwD
MPRMSRHSAVALALVLAATAAASAAEAAAPDAQGYADRVLGALNAYRHDKGLPALTVSPALVGLAARHSADMAARQRPSHDGFAQRFEATGAELCVENVAQGFRVPEQVLNGWRRVPTHHRNVLEQRVRYVGIAASGLYATFFACDTRE